MKYLVIADHVAHGIADILDVVTHPTESKEKLKEFAHILRSAPNTEEYLIKK